MSLQHFSTQRAIPQARDLVLDLVADVAAYPRFIPWIKAVRLWAKKENLPKTSFSAEAIIGFRMLTERFATTVEKNQTLGTVTTKLIQGPFRALDCKWTITPAGTGCSVDFEIDYEFSNPILAALWAANFGKAVGKLMDAFETEAARREATQ